MKGANNVYPFDPDWCIRPGETLRDFMEHNNLPARVMAKACGMPEEAICDLLAGKLRITDVVALHLEMGTQIPMHLWLNLERHYREGLKVGKQDVSDG